MGARADDKPTELVGIPVKYLSSEQRKLYQRWQWAKHGEREIKRRKTIESVKARRRVYDRDYRRLHRAHVLVAREGNCLV